MSPRWVFLALLPGVFLRPATEVVVTYRTFQVMRDTVRVPVGSTVRWVNEDQVLHTVTGGSPEKRTAGWDAALPTAGTSTTRRFDRAGTYTYFCDRHQFMRGTVVVTNTR